MKLFEHADFDQAILRAAEHFKAQASSRHDREGLFTSPRACASVAGAGDKVIFKGGTSLLKGWDLIARFSEDIDIFLDPAPFDPPLGGNGINRELKKLRDAVAAHPG